MPLCDCGALDCPRCYPENFVKIDGHLVYKEFAEEAKESIESTYGDDE